MTELRPLLSQHDDEFELALLRSADHDEPSGRGKLRIAAALGIGVGAAASSLAAASGSAAAVSSGAATASGVSGAGAKVGLSAVLKSLAIGTATGAVTLGTLHYADMLPAPFRATPSVVSQAAPRPTPAAANPVLSVPAPTGGADSVGVAEASRELAPNVGTDRRRQKLDRPKPVAPPEPVAEPALPEAVAEPEPSEAPKAQSIAGEIAEIDRIRGRLRDGQAAGALSDLERYFRSSPTRVLQTEASLLRIDALVALGERQRASTLAREFIARQPTSRYAERLRQLAGN